jgi:TRAP-type transport system periplasmic protein
MFILKTDPKPKEEDMMKKVTIILAVLIFSFSAVSGAVAKTKWDLHLNFPAGNFHSKGAQRFADRVKEATNGELNIVLHPGASLGFKGPELLRAIAESQLVIGEIATGMVEGDAPALALTAQPFISTNAFEQRLLYQLAKPTYAKILKKFNQFTLYSSVWPFSGIYTQRAIKSESDLKGLKMRVYDGTGLAFGKATGIAARKMPFSEVYPAMKAGLMDSMYTSSVSGVDAKAWEILKYFTPINIVGPVNLVNVNLDAWNELPKNIQETVLAVAVQLEDEMWNLAGDMDRKSRETLIKKGMVINPVDKKFRSQLDTVGNKLRATWAKKAGKDAQNILKEYYRITGR